MDKAKVIFLSLICAVVHNNYIGQVAIYENCLCPHDYYDKKQLVKSSKYFINEKGNERVTHVKEYNNDGLLTEERIYDANKKKATLVRQVDYYFNNLLPREVVRQKGGVRKIEKYNKEGFIISSRVFGELNKQFEYDTIGNLILINTMEMKSFFVNRKLQTVFKYNEKGLLLSTNYFELDIENVDSVKNHIFETTNKYNDKNQVIEYSYYTFSSNRNSKKLYERRKYFYSGSEIVKIEYYENEFTKGVALISTEVFSYNEFGCISNIRINYSGSNIIKNIQYIVNNRGQLRKSIRELNNEIKSATFYYYDLHGNIEKEEYKTTSDTSIVYYLNEY